MPLQDRAHGLAAVRAAAARVRSGADVLVAVTGPPGTGRSAFLASVADEVARDGLTVRRTMGAPAGADLTADPLPGLPLPVASPADDVLPGRSAHGGLRFPPGGGAPPPGPEPARAGARRTVVLEAAGRPDGGPAALLVDDLHWADRDLLTRLADSARGSARSSGGREDVPRLTVVTVCEGEAATEQPDVQDILTAADHIVRMGPLGAADVRALLRARGIALTGAQAAEWTEATGGNPALIASLLDRLDDLHGHPAAGLLALARSRPSPLDLWARVAAVLTGHSGTVRRYAHCAALVGGPAEGSLLGRLAGLDPLEEAGAARTLLRLGWAADRASPPVLWDCVREIADDALSLTDRTRLHRRAAELLHESGAPAEQTVPLLLEVSPGEWSGAARVLREAACEAWSRGDDSLAARCLRRALREFLPDSPQRGDFLAALADAEQGADTSVMLRHVIQALPLLSSPGERAAVAACVPLTLFLTAPQTAWEMLRHTGYQDHGDPCRPPGPVGPATGPAAADSAMRLEARARLFRAGTRPAAAAAVERLRALTPGHGPVGVAERELVSVLVFSGLLGGELSAPEVAARVRWMLEHEPASAAAGYAAPALMVAAGAAASVADESMLSWLDMALVTAGQRGDDRLRTHVLGWRTLTALRAGRLADAWSSALAATVAAPAVLGDDDVLTALALTSAALETGDPVLAGRLRALLREDQAAETPVHDLALRMLRTPQAPEPELRALADLLLDALRRTEAGGWTNHVLLPMDLWCATLLRRLGERDAALGLFAHACERARQFGAHAPLGRVLRLWGGAVQGRYALSLLAESVEVLREGPDRLELGRALIAYGGRLRAAGRPGHGPALAEADRIAEEVGASLLDAAPVPGGHRGPGASPAAVVLGRGPLSDTERRVAALVAVGHTSQDVADALGVTRRAVEKVLTRLYQRFGVTGRAEFVPVVHGIAGRAAFGSGLFAEAEPAGTGRRAGRVPAPGRAAGLR
ncbi:AAA family ATPase [Streptomyces sp. NPDC050560]|uniref:helix-turn-helix transcriptional regulator n=1 Tax=Streptomyces sp. NPDC050560 TaxID=3365630 RepID=UPI0037AD9A10